MNKDKYFINTKNDKIIFVWNIPKHLVSKSFGEYDKDTRIDFTHSLDNLSRESWESETKKSLEFVLAGCSVVTVSPKTNSVAVKDVKGILHDIDLKCIYAPKNVIDAFYNGKTMNKKIKELLDILEDRDN